MSRERTKSIQMGMRAARLFYELRGAVILEIDWSCEYGEIAIIALDDDCLVFCEVRVRDGLPVAVDRRDEEVVKCATLYRKTCKHAYKDVRYDHILVIPNGATSGSIHYIPNVVDASKSA